MGVARAHGLDPDDAVVILAPRPGERHLAPRTSPASSTAKAPRSPSWS